MEDVLNSFLKGVVAAQIWLAHYHRLDAIWITSKPPLWLIEDGVLKRTVRYTDGQLVRIEAINRLSEDRDGVSFTVIEGWLMDCNGNNQTHRITKCFGAGLYNLTSAELHLLNLETNIEEILKII